MRSIVIMIISTVCSIIGGVIGDFFGTAWALILSTIAGIYGLWLGYKIYRDYLE